mgnify:CR=1 FL=1
MPRRVVGIDIGSVAISLAVIENDGNVVSTAYRLHEGAIHRTLAELLGEIDITTISAVAMTTAGPDILEGVPRFDTYVAMMTAVRRFHERVGSILFVGGENFGLVTFTEEGDYEGLRSNSSCAAGTGGFLDQQARRLALANTAVLGTLAFCNKDARPKIATRCAVFAKTDLIHAQQEGYSVGQISDGLCEGLAKNIVDTVGNVQRIRPPLIIAGGVALNRAVVRHLARFLNLEPIVGEYAHLYPAIGAALLSLEEGGSLFSPLSSWETLFIHERKERQYGYPPLTLRYSSYPDFSSHEPFFFEPSSGTVPVEVEVYEPHLQPQEEVYLGIDIGSTSTKAALIRKDRTVVAGFYTATAGKPLPAVQVLFEAMEHLGHRTGTTWKFTGVGTTGSGRKFIGRVINADLVVDEITAHARAAYELDPAVDTIIEIGGQDALSLIHI